ncbi:MAG: ABC transporter substrate-binding protein [Lentisphaeria bacterium]|nr:ABC transporter substrate-binding protein [Lentisphaeria bacterium]
MIRRFILPGILLLGGLIAGCQHTRSLDEAPKIGVILPLSGAYAPYGKEILEGIQVARAGLESKMYGDPLPDLLIYDDVSDRRKAQEIMRNLAAENVAAILIGYSSQEALAVKEDAKTLQIPVLTPAGSNDRITVDNPYMFRCNFSDSQQSRALAHYAYYERGCRRLAVLFNLEEESVYARELGRQTGQNFSDLGGLLCARAGFRESDQDFSKVAREILAKEPDVVMVPAYPKCAGMIVKALREAGFRGLILGSDSWNGQEFLEHCGPNPGPAVFGSVYCKETAGDTGKVFIDAYRKRFQSEPTVNAALGYDAMMLIAMAVRGTATSAEVLDRMGRIRGFLGAAGEITMRSDGSVLRPIHMIRLKREKGGKSVFAYEMTIPVRYFDQVENPDPRKKGNGSIWGI